MNEPSAIALRNAVLCVDCDCVSNSNHHSCVVCGSAALIGLAKVLSREPMMVPDAGSPLRPMGAVACA